MTKILKAEEFINEQVVNEMGMRVRNKNIQQKMSDQLKKYNLVYNEETGLYDCDGDVKVEKDLVSPDGKLIVKFGVVKGNFNCSHNELTSLEGAPQEVGGWFNCLRNQLTSLEGAPKEVGEDFDCSFNQLTSLEGAPQKVGTYFDCGVNKLTSLEGAPKEVGGDFDCYNNKLTSLVGAPQKVGGSFRCSKNQLTSLEEAPKEVGESFNCRYNKLTSLEGAPQEVGGDFYCDNNDNLVFDEIHFYGCLPDVIGGELVAGDDCDYELAKEYYVKNKI